MFFCRGLLKDKQKKTPTEYNLLNYCILLLKENSYGANLRGSLYKTGSRKHVIPTIGCAVVWDL